MKTGFWREAIESAFTSWFTERKGARQLEPGATPQELIPASAAALRVSNSMSLGRCPPGSR